MENGAFALKVQDSSTHSLSISNSHRPGMTEILLKSTENRKSTVYLYKPETSFCSYARPAQPGSNRTRLCGPCIAAIAGD